MFVESRVPRHTSKSMVGKTIVNHLIPSYGAPFNAKKQISCRCKLLFCLALPITFKQELKNQEAEEGNNVTLRCELSKSGAQVEWWRGEELLKPGEKYQMRHMATKMELVIRKVVPQDSGVYTCVGPDQKSNAIVTIKGMKPLTSGYLITQTC